MGHRIISTERGVRVIESNIKGKSMYELALGSISAALSSPLISRTAAGNRA